MQIVVPASPTAPQLAAALRQVILWLAGAATTIGFAGIGGQLNGWLSFVGPVAAIIAFVWGQLHTRSAAVKGAAMADQLPESVATTK